MTSTPPPPEAPGTLAGRLRIIATTDLHANLTGHDFSTGVMRTGLGLAALAPVIEAARAEADNALFFDNGDLLEGTAFGEEAAEALAADDPHPMVAALNMLGCDAATAGNHDFGFGLDAALSGLCRGRFPGIMCESDDAGW